MLVTLVILFIISGMEVLSQGKYWSKVVTPSGKSSDGLFAEFGTLYLFDNGASYKSTDQGKGWTRNINTTPYFCDPTAKQMLIKSADSFGGVYASFNKGDTWSFIHTFEYMGSINSVCFITDTTAYISTDNGVFFY